MKVRYFIYVDSQRICELEPKYVLDVDAKRRVADGWAELQAISNAGVIVRSRAFQ